MGAHVCSFLRVTHCNFRPFSPVAWFALHSMLWPVFASDLSPTVDWVVVNEIFEYTASPGRGDTDAAFYMPSAICTRTLSQFSESWVSLVLTADIVEFWMDTKKRVEQ